MPLISRHKAKQIIRAKTGRSIAWTEEQVAKMPKTVDGKLLKVSEYQLNNLNSTANRELEQETANPTGFRFSAKKAQRIIENCI